MKVHTYSDFVQFHEPSGLTNFYQFRKALSDAEIETIRELAKQTERQLGTAGGKVNLGYRSSRISWLYLDDSTGWLYSKLGRMVKEANDALWNFSLVGMSEAIQFGEYHAADKGHYDWHIDLGSQRFARRKISVVIQLSDPDDYDGGDLELQFAQAPQKIPRGKGFACLFPSYTIHRVTPVTRGVRRSLVIWVSGEPFR